MEVRGQPQVTSHLPLVCWSRTVNSGQACVASAFTISAAPNLKPRLERKVEHYIRKLIMKENKKMKNGYFISKKKKQINGYILS